MAQLADTQVAPDPVNDNESVPLVGMHAGHGGGGGGDGGGGSARGGRVAGELRRPLVLFDTFDGSFVAMDNRADDVGESEVVM